MKHKATDPHLQHCSSDPSKQELFEQIIARYESDWHRNHLVRWQDYLPTDEDELQAALAVELAAIEAEFLCNTKSSSSSDNLDGNYCPPTEHQNMGTDASVGNPSSHDSTAFHTSATGLTSSFRATSEYSSVVQEIHGGLGDIYVIRDEALERVVVVKQLQARWLGNARALRAFHREVRITSLLEHPSIVPVHTLGTTNDGRPFYSMRYVDGQTLQQAVQLLHQEPTFEMATLRGLLTHFIQVCRTIAFANTQRIIHRDLKPANIVIGNFGQTLVLDWGLAKELPSIHPSGDSSGDSFVADSLNKIADDESIDDTVEFSIAIETEHKVDPERGHSKAGDIVGTPAYMSPEQASGKLNDYSVRTDVFGLGAVLYAILYGKPPYAGRNSSDTIRLAEVAAIDFETGNKSNDPTYRGLKAICRKATSKLPRDRYSDAQSLADDLENWLAGENIALQQQPLTYRFTKFVSRKRTLAVLASLLTLTTIVATVAGVLSVQMERSQRMVAANEAEARTQEARRITEYLAKVYRSADPISFDDPGFTGKGDGSSRSTLRQILDAGHKLLSQDLKQNREPYADLLLSLGASYRGLGDYDRAEQLLTEARQVWLELVGAEHLQTLNCDYQLCRLAYAIGDYSEAESQCRLLIETINRVVDKSKETSDNNSLTTSLTLLQANAKYQLGWLLFYQPLGLELPQFKPENIAESQKLFREVIDTRKKLLPKKDRSLGLAYAGLAASLLNSKETEQEAIITVAHAMEIFNASDQENSFGSFLIEYNRAEKLRYRDNNYEEAEKQYVKLANFIVNQVGEGHPVFAIHCWNMVGMYRKWGQFDKAEQMIARIRKTVNQCPSIRCSQVHLDCLKQYAEALQENGRSFEAKEVYQEILRFASERSNLHTQLISLVEERLKQE